MEIKLIFAMVASTLGIIFSSIPYIRDIILKKITPHSFTWLIWAITQGTATAALWYDKAGAGVIYPTIGTLSISLIFFLSLRYGEKNITRTDIIILAVAILAILIWWLTNNPLISLILVCFIDVIAYIPTFRKSYSKPWSETLFPWITSTIISLLSIFALERYTWLTLPYLITTFFSNVAFITFIYLRRRKTSGDKS